MHTAQGNDPRLPRVIAVDGPAGSGKTSVSSAAARQLGYLFVDTGVFYRAITFLTLEQRLDPTDGVAIAALAHTCHFELACPDQTNPLDTRFLANGRDITDQLHHESVDAYVSVVAAHPQVRAAILAAQRQLAETGRVIMAGRDIGSVVLPDADLKIYIDASLEQRAERRYAQRLRNHEPADLDAIREGLAERDRIDSTRTTAPLLRPSDAVYLDTTDLTFEQAVQAVVAIIRSRATR